MSINPTVDSSAFDLFLSTPAATAAREVLYDDALASFGGSTTPWALAVREILHGAPALVPPKVVVVVSETPAAPVNRTLNATSQWLAQNAKTVYSTLIGHLSSKMQRSHELSVVEDHVQEFLARLVDDDRLAPLPGSPDGRRRHPRRLRAARLRGSDRESTGTARVRDAPGPQIPGKSAPR